MNPIRRILAKLRRRKAKASLGRYFHQSVLAFNNGTKIYMASNDFSHCASVPSVGPSDKIGMAATAQEGTALNTVTSNCGEPSPIAGTTGDSRKDGNLS